MLTNFLAGNNGNNVLGILIGALIGLISSIAVEFLRRRTKKEQKIDEYESINESAERNVKSAQAVAATAQMVSSMLEVRLTQEREHFDRQMLRSKEDCQRQINDMKNQYDAEIKIMQIDLAGKEKELMLLREVISKFTEGKK